MSRLPDSSCPPRDWQDGQHHGDPLNKHDSVSPTPVATIRLSAAVRGAAPSRPPPAGFWLPMFPIAAGEHTLVTTAPTRAFS